jgi:hypothetical protein
MNIAISNNARSAQRRSDGLIKVTMFYQKREIVFHKRSNANRAGRENFPEFTFIE